MSDVLYLKPQEPVRLDRGQLEALVAQLGPAGADQLVGHAMEELAVLLSRIEKQNRAGRLGDVQVSVTKVTAIAQDIGLTSLARIGRDVLDLIQTCDSTAYGATVARLVRAGESSLIAVWDLQDVTV